MDAAAWESWTHPDDEEDATGRHDHLVGRGIRCQLLDALCTRDEE